MGFLSAVFFLSTKWRLLWYFAERKSSRDIRIVFVIPIVTFKVIYQFSPYEAKLVADLL